MHEADDLPDTPVPGVGGEVVGVPQHAPTTATTGLTPAEARHADVSSRWFPETLGGVVYLVMLLGAVAAVLVVVLVDWRTGVRIFAGVHVVAALARLVLPASTAGMLAVRSRATDVVLHVVVAGVMVFLAGSIPDQPL
ncbi:DUF3017 domain-containing protein [Nocardioides yefusunii]|uniref:DUF3017 domain-containing protein n=1 Tax=Nocardioides yefusunii TaxID=2500546 RepID=A0ABW1QY37_9ACTN|nr:DUF3017 domain-containing protein [Nocardioides yefusunii]